MRDAMLRGVSWSVALCSLWPFWFLAALPARSVRPSNNHWLPRRSRPQSFSRAIKSRMYVFGEDKLSGDYQIDQSGQISLPLAGTIQAVGLTQSELEQALAKKFRSEYLKNPKVTVTIATLQPFYMMGEVTKPGEYPYKSGLNVLTAMAIAGGPTYRASRSTVQIQRRGESSMRDYPIRPRFQSYPAM